MNENRIIGRNLKALREANCYTQQQVADFLGITRSAYSNYELGEREAPIEVLENLASLMGCELEVLFESDETVVNDMLIVAFRAEDVSESDLTEIAAFKSVVLNYMKMKRMLAE